MNPPPAPPRPPPPPPTLDAGAKVNPQVNSCYQSPLRLEYDKALELAKEAVSSALDRVPGQDQGTLVIYSPLLNPILQNGPVCGLIALIEAVQILVGDQSELNLDPDTLLQEARGRGITRHGEIFSALDMQQLAESYFHLESCVIGTKSKDLDAIWRLLGSHLLQGKVVLIPYDADYNHGPALRKGHSAHWAVIHGMTIKVLDHTMPSEQESENDIKVIDPTKHGNQPQFSNIFQAMQSSTSYVLAHHGKSLRIAVWSFQDLMKSNQNLDEISPKIKSVPDEEKYVLRDIKSELCSKLVLLGISK